MTSMESPLNLSSFWLDPEAGAAAITSWAFAHVRSRAVAFWDFDGVIADSEPVHQEAYLAVAKEFGFFVPEGVKVRPGLREELSWNGLNEDGAQVPREAYAALQAARRNYVVERLMEQGPSPFASVLLPALARAGVCQVVASMGDPETNRVLLAGWGLTDVFTAGTPGLGKVELLQEGGCLYLEDNLPYIEIAQDLHLPTVGIRHEVNADQVWPAIPEVSLNP